MWDCRSAICLSIPPWSPSRKLVFFTHRTQYLCNQQTSAIHVIWFCTRNENSIYLCETYITLQHQCTYTKQIANRHVNLTEDTPQARMISQNNGFSRFVVFPMTLCNLTRRRHDHDSRRPSWPTRCAALQAIATLTCEERNPENWEPWWWRCYAILTCARKLIVKPA